LEPKARKHKGGNRSFGSRWKNNIQINLKEAGCYKCADKSLAWPEKKQATATEDFDVRISYL
jgi:hypothetical protein